MPAYDAAIMNKMTKLTAPAWVIIIEKPATALKVPSPDSLMGSQHYLNTPAYTQVKRSLSTCPVLQT